jgi:hypothetical protein
MEKNPYVEIYNLYCSQNIIKNIKPGIVSLTGHVARIWEIINVCKVLVGKYEVKRQLGEPR